MATTATDREHISRILLIDDEDLIVRAVRRMLEAETQFEICSACDGETGLVAFETEPPFDVLITDIHLPDMSGTTLARKLRILKPDLKIIFMSGAIPTDIDPSAGTLTKPFRHDDLMHALENALESRRL